MIVGDIQPLLAILEANAGMTPEVDGDHPSIEVWSEEPGGELRRWLLIAIGERTVTVMNPHNRHDRALRNRRVVWLNPDALTFRAEGPKGYARQSRATWTREQGAIGRRNAAKVREAAVAKEAQG